MTSSKDIIESLLMGRQITCYGNPVSLEGLHVWQEQKIIVNLANGAAYIANFRDIQAMKIKES